MEGGWEDKNIRNTYHLSLITYLFFRLDILINIRMGEGYRYVWLHSRNERK